MFVAVTLSASIIFMCIGMLCVRHVWYSMHDLGELARLRPQKFAGQQREHAVVLGGSWTGMLTAAVLAPYFQRITVIERDTADDLASPQPRRGVPQGQQSHVIVRYAVAFANTLLPTFEAALREAGGHTGGDMGTDFRWFHRGRWRLQQPLGLPMWFASRPLVEWALRQTVLRVHSHVSLQPGTRVMGLLPGTAKQVGGVHCSDRTQDLELSADLVVDCMGKHSHSPRWLAALGWTPIRESVVDSATFYATRRFTKPTISTPLDTWAMTWHGHHDTERRGQFAGAVTVEHNTVYVWAVQTGRAVGTSPNAFNAFFHDMGTADLAAQVEGDAQAVALGDACAFGAGPSRRRLFGRAQVPDNFVALGDAVCCTNPAFGLGLSLSASTVACLAHVLHRRAAHSKAGAPWSLQGLGKEAARRVAWRTWGPWVLSSSEEYRLPHTQGPHRERAWVLILQWYVERAFHSAHHHAWIDSRVLHVVTLMAHPLRVFSPGLIWQVLSAGSLAAPVASPNTVASQR